MKRTGPLARIIPVLLAVVLVFGALPAAAAAPETEPAVELTAALEGSEVSVEIRTVESVGIDGMCFSFSYDTAGFAFKEVTSAAFPDPVVNESGKTVLLSSGNSQTFPAGTVLATLKFDLGSGYTPGNEYVFTVSFTEVIGADLTGFDWQTASISAVLKEDLTSVTANLTSVTLTLKGAVGIYFYLSAPESAARAVITYAKEGSEPVEYTLTPTEANFNAEQGLYTYKLLFPNIPAAEMTLDATLLVYDAQGGQMRLTAAGKSLEGNRYSFCAADWGRKILSSASSSDKAKDMARALLNYGSYAMKFFGKTDWEDPDPDLLLADEMAQVQPNSEYDLAKPANAETMGYKGLTLVLEGATELRLYFKDPVTAADASGKSYEVKQGQGMYYVSIPNIPAKNLHTMYTVNVTKGSETGSFRVCALSYANNILNDSSQTEKSVNICRALYLYNQAAAIYLAK